MTEHVRIEALGPILNIELNRPEKKNALTVEMYQALAEALAAANSDDDLRVILITGVGDAFTAGNDLRDFLDRPPTGEGSPVHQFLGTLIDVRVPVIAAVQGVAVGIGTTLLLHCDLIYAARSARFHVPFTALGLVPEAASSLLLPQRIGYARAAEMLLLGEPLGAEEAAALGLISGVFDDGSLMEQVWARAERLAALPPESVQTTKSLMRDAIRHTVAEQMRRESERFGERLRSEEARDAMRRFFESRGGGRGG